VTRFSKFLLALAILGGGVGGFYLLTTTKPVAEPQAVMPTIWRVAAQTVVLGAEHPEFSGFATIENTQTQLITAPLATQVVDVFVQTGRRVTAGTPLLQLYRLDAESRLKQSEASLADVEGQLAQRALTQQKDQAALVLDRELLAILEAKRTRITDLRARGLASDEQLETARQAVVGQQLQINRRELTLATNAESRTILLAQKARIETDVRLAQEDVVAMSPRASMDGVITDVTITAGDRVGANQGLLRLVPDRGYELRFAVPKDVAQSLRAALTINQPIMGTTERGDSIRVDRVAGAVNAQTGTVDVYARLEGSTTTPTLGAITAVRLRLPPIDGLAVVPTDALYGGNTLYRIREGQLESLAVESFGQRIGAAGTEVLIRSESLQSGDQILISRLPAATTGLRVEVIQ